MPERWKLNICSVYVITIVLYQLFSLTIFSTSTEKTTHVKLDEIVLIKQGLNEYRLTHFFLDSLAPTCISSVLTCMVRFKTYKHIHHNIPVRSWYEQTHMHQFEVIIRCHQLFRRRQRGNVYPHRNYWLSLSCKTWPC